MSGSSTPQAPPLLELEHTSAAGSRTSPFASSDPTLQPCAGAAVEEQRHSDLPRHSLHQKRHQLQPQGQWGGGDAALRLPPSQRTLPHAVLPWAVPPSPLGDAVASLVHVLAASAQQPALLLHQGHASVAATSGAVSAAAAASFASLLASPLGALLSPAPAPPSPWPPAPPALPVRPPAYTRLTANILANVSFRGLFAAALDSGAHGNDRALASVAALPRVAGEASSKRVRAVRAAATHPAALRR